MKKTVKRIRVNIVFETILIAVLAASLCACSGSTPGEHKQPSVTVVDEPNTTENEFPNQDASGTTDTSEENIPDIIEEEPPTVTILGNKYELNTEILDLSAITHEDVAAVAESIRELPELKIVNLMPGAAPDATPESTPDAAPESIPDTTPESTPDAAPESTPDAAPESTPDAAPESTPNREESALLLSDVALLKEAASEVHFIYEFDLFDNHISTSDTEVQYINRQIGNEGEESIRQALTILDECTYFLLDDCGIDDEIMAGIREDFPETKVVWRVHVGNKTALTDDQVIRMTHGVTDSMTEPLKYCNEVLYMDLGHNSGITDISFLAGMPLLECLILSEAQFKDLSPVTNCPNLTWLELIYCLSFDDISVIGDMDSVKYLNISNTKISDISGIMNMNLDRFCCIDNRVSKESFEAFKEAHPDCMSVKSGNPYGYAWRYDDYGYHYFSYYARMREVFRYEQRSPGGFKMPEEENE